MAADVDQQRAVVGGRPRVIPGAGELTQAQRDAALAQDVLHRLAEPQIDPQRQRGEQVREPGTRIGSVTHADQPTHRASSEKTRKMRGSPHDPGAAAS
jgi:hypothetical protein